jgi:hypothetical protein
MNEKGHGGCKKKLKKGEDRRKERKEGDRYRK